MNRLSLLRMRMRVFASKKCFKKNKRLFDTFFEEFLIPYYFFLFLIKYSATMEIEIEIYDERSIRMNRN